MVVVYVDIVSYSLVRSPRARAVDPLRLVRGRRERRLRERRCSGLPDRLRRLLVGPGLLDLLLLGSGFIKSGRERPDVGRGHFVAGFLVSPGDLVGPPAVQYIVDGAGVPAVTPECCYLGAYAEGFGHSFFFDEFALVLAG